MCAKCKCDASLSIPSILFATVFVLIFETRAYVSAKSVIRERRSQDGKVCGVVKTSANITVQLVEGMALSPEEYEKLHVQKLKDAHFIPDITSQCAIQVCGFTSYGDPLKPGFIGSQSDYADCKVFTTEASAPSEIYNDGYNLSSISCGCMGDSKQCIYNCESRVTTLQPKWKANDCAVLFQESGCNSCYLSSVTLSNGQNFSTDNAHTFRSIVLRERCRVLQSIPALKRMYRFVNVEQPIEYVNNSQSNVKSSFQSDTEYFHCECGSAPLITTTPQPAPEPPTPPVTLPPDKPASFISVTDIVLIVGGVVVGLMMVSGGLGVMFWKRKFFFSGEDTLIKQNHDSSNSSAVSTATSITTAGDDTNNEQTLELGDSRILNQPLDVAFNISNDHWQVDQPLDEGNFGQVHKGFLQVAIKTVKINCGPKKTQASKQSLHQEIRILAHLGAHENVVRLLGYSVTDLESVTLITELCQNGSLKSYLESTVKPRIVQKLSQIALRRLESAMGDDGYPELRNSENTQADLEEINESNLENIDPEMLSQFYKWIVQIASGMQYIQSKKVIHIDLAIRNVLLTHKLIAKIGDFGLSLKTYIKNYVSAKKTSLPLRWVSPEALENCICSTKSDVWSFGVTVWEIFNLGVKVPYEDLSDIRVCTFIIGGGHLQRPEYASEEVYSYLEKCWKKDPNERPSFDELKSYFETKLPQMPTPGLTQENLVEGEEQTDQ